MVGNYNEDAVKELVKLRSKFLELYPESIEVISVAMGEAVNIVEKHYEIRDDVLFPADENHPEDYVENMEVVNISVSFYEAVGMDWKKINT